MIIVNFTPWSALLGGALIGLGAAGMWWLLGRIAGVSTILGAAMASSGIDRGWRLAFLLGLFTAGLVGIAFAPGAIAFDLQAGYGQVILAGSFTRALPARPGSTFNVDFGPLGSISCHFT